MSDLYTTMKHENMDELAKRLDFNRQDYFQSQRDPELVQTTNMQTFEEVRTARVKHPRKKGWIQLYQSLPSKGGRVTLPNVTASHSVLAIKKTSATFDLTVRVLLSENRPVVIIVIQWQGLSTD